MKLAPMPMAQPGEYAARTPIAAAITINATRRRERRRLSGISGSSSVGTVIVVGTHFLVGTSSGIVLLAPRRCLLAQTPPLHLVQTPRCLGLGRKSSTLGERGGTSWPGHLDIDEYAANLEQSRPAKRY